MESGYMRFDPASEFEILETLDFEEEIQRPESMRFFTLDEQLLDYFDKVIPKEGKVTKFEYNRISTQVDRLRDIYNKTITLTDTDYTVDLSRKEVNVDWVKSIYTSFGLSSYSFAEKFLPLYGPSLRSTPNYYPRMLAALPKPYRSSSEEGTPYTGTAVMVNEDGEKPINVLGTYERSKGVLHEDGSFTVVKLPIPNTTDEITTKGFYIEKRPLDIPNPLSNHPFFASNEPHSYLTDEPLLRVFPTLEAVMTHGVPSTTDPYGEGKKFLKLYDVKLSQIPWNLWKERFPTVGIIASTPEILSVTFPKGDDIVEPSKGLQEIYTLKWYPGIEPRQWLTGQEDAGTLVSKMLLTQAGKSGLVPPAILGERPESKPVASTPEECFTFDTFDGLVNAGIYRKGVCIPMPQVIQEKADMIVGNKVAWKETTPADILKDHQELLKFFQYLETPIKQKPYEKYASQPESDTRRLIKALLRDPERDPVDKASAIELLLRGASHKEEQWFGPDDSFLICSHTLAYLRGDMETDKNAFYEKWTFVDDGFRACRFCGERINNDVFVAQDDFDENGKVVISHDVLDSGDAFKGESHVESFSNSLGKLKPIFMLENPGESIFYLLLSLLQILPKEEQLLPVVQFIRGLTGLLRSNKAIDKTKKERIEGVLGIVGATTLVLIHNPFLIPRRSFGSKVLKLSGFPRDSDDPSNAPALDIMISVLRTTFQASPNTFKGPIATILRLVINSPKEVRRDAVDFLKRTTKQFEAQYAAAKERYETPIEADITSSISIAVVRREQNTFSPQEAAVTTEQMAECSNDIPNVYITGRLPPNVRQEDMKFMDAKPSPSAESVIPKLEKHAPVKITEDDIRKSVKLGFPKGLKLEKLERFVNADVDSVALYALLNRLLDILSLEKFSLESLARYRESSIYLETRLVRDAIRGLLFELFHEISDSKNKAGLVSAISTAIQRDLALNMVLLTKEQATRQDSDLRTREREVFKLRMRNMNDTDREVTKMLLDIGIAPYIITNEDRELFAKEYNLPDPEAEYNDAIAQEDIDRPEDGYNTARDFDEDGVAIDVTTGRDREVDHGQYGDRRDEITDRDYERQYWTNLDEGDGF